MPIPPPEHTTTEPQVGEFYVNRGTGALVEIMAVEPSGDVMVLDVTAPLDGQWQRLTHAQIFSSFWVRARDYAAAA